MANDPEYQREYYRRNKERIRAQKRERYRKDKEYREAIKKRSAVVSALRSLEVKKHVPVAKHGGRKERLFYLSHMAEVANRDSWTLANWTRGNPPLIPKALYHDSRGRGLYSKSQVTYLSKILHRVDLGKLRLTYRHMRHILEDVWKLRFSEDKLTETITEVLHGKYYEADRKEDEARRKKGRRPKKSGRVKTKAELAGM